MKHLLSTLLLAACFAGPSFAQIHEALPNDLLDPEDPESAWTAGGVRPGPAFSMPRTPPVCAANPEILTLTPVITTQVLPADELLAEDDRFPSSPLRIGKVYLAPSNSVEHGLWTPQSDGSWVYTISFYTPGAKGLRITIPRWLPQGECSVTFFNPDEISESWGPYGAGDAEQNGSLVSPIIWGDRIAIEYRVPADVDLALPAVVLATSSVTALYRSPFEQQVSTTEVACHLDVNCYSAWNDVSDSVAYLIVQNSLESFSCSGAMMFQQNGSFRPVFATARHCSLNTPEEDLASLTVWRWETASCNGTLPTFSNLDQVRTYCGLHVHGGSDLQLIGLRPEVPGYVWYAGWNTNDVSFNESVYGIHHPRATHKRISFMTKSLNTGSLAPLDSANSCGPSNQHLCLISSGNGRVEPGSSGSPLFTSDGAVRGVLSCSSDASCASGNVQTASYGRFQLGFPLVGQFLQPQDTVWVQAGFGGIPRGTSSEPFDRFVQAGYGSRNDATVNVRAGTYNERVTVNFPMKIRAVGGVVRIGP